MLATLARPMIRQGRLDLIDASGRRHVLPGARPGPCAALRLHSRSAEFQIAMDPALQLGETYMAGGWDPEDCDLADVLAVLAANAAPDPGRPAPGRLQRLARFATRRLAQHNPLRRSRQNVAHHYDLSPALYDTFLDRDRHYSCAYFSEGCDDLEEAQQAKVDHLAAKLRLEGDPSVLDIGCGWGGLALGLARRGAGRVHGVTLSTEQHAYASGRAAREGLANQVRFELKDYRDLSGTYDRIVSVGMFEHVGVGHYQTYFDTVRDRLNEDGVAVIHAIGRSGPPGVTNAWVAKYIFPGGYVPALSEVLPAVERAGLKVTDLEILRLHYAETLRHWRARFNAARDAVKALYDERFCRMWEFYLAGSEMSFRTGDLMVFQIQLARQHAAVPIRRDYIPLEEARARAARQPVAA